ncbi:MAG: acyltransferase family protein [Bacilli bacterium]|nr:acyltransferase family protein [Bacilli bacterium]
MEQERDFRFDNLRLILIFFVVFGHFLELVSGSVALNIYKIIYMFHMPVFVFLAGRFAKFDIKKIGKRLIVPYIIFQIGYEVFSDLVLKHTDLSVQFTTPYWLLWFLLAIIFYYLLIPVLPKKESKLKYLVIGLAFIVGLLAGFEKTIGYYLSLSRVLVFFPMFLIGYYSKDISQDIEKIIKRPKLIGLIVSIVLIISITTVLLIIDVPKHALYGSYAYSSTNGSIWIRLLLYIVSLSWITLLCLIIPNKRIPFISVIGQDTMLIYLLHGFIVKYLETLNLFKFNQAVNILISLALSIGIVVLFGNKFVVKVFAKITK